MTFSDSSAAEVNALCFAGLLFPKEITGKEMMWMPEQPGLLGLVNLADALRICRRW